MTDDGLLHDVPGQRPVVATHQRFVGKVWDVSSDEVDLGQGRVVTRDYLKHTGAVAIMALNEAGEVYLVRQYRHPIGAECWEPPAGLLDAPGEAPVEAAKRELFEEADLTAATWHTLVDYHPSGGGTSESVRVFLARDLAEVPEAERHAREDEELDMEGRWVPLETLVASIYAGGVHSSTAVAGGLALHAALLQGLAPLRPADAPWLRAPEHTRLAR